MRIEGLVTDATPVESPHGKEHASSVVLLAEHLLVNSGHICGRGATL